MNHLSMIKQWFFFYGMVPGVSYYEENTHPTPQPHTHTHTTPPDTHKKQQQQQQNIVWRHGVTDNEDPMVTNYSDFLSSFANRVKFNSQIMCQLSWLFICETIFLLYFYHHFLFISPYITTQKHRKLEFFILCSCVGKALALPLIASVIRSFRFKEIVKWL